MIFFASGAGVAALTGMAAFVAGLLEPPEATGVVFYSVSLLYAALAAALLLWGVLGELVYRTGDLKLEYFTQIKSSIKNAGPE
jgi:hypothetical protein